MCKHYIYFRLNKFVGIKVCGVEKMLNSFINYKTTSEHVFLYVYVVAVTWRARIWGKCLTIHSLPALFFFNGD